MYEYVTDQNLLNYMRQTGKKIIQELCMTLKSDFGIGATPVLVGSASRNLITQNGDEIPDIDYNIKIQKCEDFYDCRYIKECVRKAFNIVLRRHNWKDCEDSRSALTAKQNIYLLWNSQYPRFSIDVCIVWVDENGFYNRLIHKKTGIYAKDEYYWNQGPNAHDLKVKVKEIKGKGRWEQLRKEYLKRKNHYLVLQDENHPSFVCYIEAVNNTYNSIIQV